MWRVNLQKSKDGQWDMLPMTSAARGRGPIGFVTITMTPLWSLAWGKVTVSETGGVAIP